MTPRERFCAALSHEEPDRVPLDLGGINTTLMVGTYERLKGFLGMHELPTRLLSKTWQIVGPDERILERLSIDTRYIFPKLQYPPEPSDKQTPSRTHQGAVEDQFVDEWGITRRFVMHYYEIAEHPLREAGSLEEIESYPWPNPEEYLVVEGLRDRARHLRENTDYALVGYIPGSLFEQAWYLRGYAELLMDFLLNKDFAHALLARILEVRKQNAEIFLREVGEYLDVIQLGDDIATQNGPAASPALYREMVKPYQAELFGLVKGRTPARLYYHKQAFTTSSQTSLQRTSLPCMRRGRVMEGGEIRYFNRRRSKDLLVRIPPGIRDGQRIRLRGMGAGAEGEAEAGDLYLKVRVRRSLFQKIRNFLEYGGISAK